MPQWPSDPKHPNSKISETTSESETHRATPASGIESALWDRIHEPRFAASPLFESSSHHSVSPTEHKELEELGTVSDDLHLALSDESNRMAADSNAAFSVIHARLMDAIEQSVETPDDEAESAPEMRDTWNTSPLISRATPARRLRRKVGNWFDNLAHKPVMRYAAACLVLVVTGVGGHHVGKQDGASALPTESLVADYQTELGSSDPLEFESKDPSPVAEQRTSAWISKHTGHAVHLPVTRNSGVKLLGARLHEVEGYQSVQTHYMKNGVRVALYQIHAPHYGLTGLNEVKWKAHSFFTKNYGSCRLVVWRKDDDIMALVTPIAMRETLDLAGTLRESTAYHTSAKSALTEPA